MSADPEPQRLTASIAICCFNSAHRLPATLARAIAAIRAIERCELVIIDNASTDGTACVAHELLHGQGIDYRVIHEPAPGLMHARFAAIRACQGNVICFIDDDNWVMDGYLARVVNVFELNDNVGVFGCSTHLPDGILVPETLRSYLSSYAVGHQYASSGVLALGLPVWGAGMAIRRSAVADLPDSGFQPVLIGRSGKLQLAGDDGELTHAIVSLGWRAWYQREILIEHAIAPERFSEQKLTDMIRGFGTSEPVLARYSRFARGQRWVGSLAYEYLYQISFALKSARWAYALIGAAHVARRLDARVRLTRQAGILHFLKHGRHLWRTQSKNFKVLASLNRARLTEASKK